MHRYLRQHPQVFLPERKEHHWFGYKDWPTPFRGPGDEVYEADRTTSRADYEARFAGATEGQAIGEAGPCNLYSPTCAASIAELVPEARFVVLLRHPARRAWSHWRWCVAQGLEPCADSVVEAVDRSEERLAAGWFPGQWDYLGVGHYHEQMARLMAHFPAEQVRTFLTRELAADPHRVCREVFELLGVEPGFRPDLSVIYNRAPRSAALYRALRDPDRATHALARCFGWRLSARAVAALQRWNAGPARASSAAWRGLVAQFDDGVRALEDILGRDLSGWSEAV